jgi:sugar lactone lactonase YvrE
MSERAHEVVMDGLGFPECPRWHDGKLWISDMAHKRVIVCPAAGKHEVFLELPDRPSGIGWLPSGEMLVVSMEQQLLLRVAQDGSVTTHADPSHLVRAHLNDMVVDADGTAYVTNLGYDAHAEDPVTTGVVRVSPDGAVEMISGGLLRPNGIVITPQRDALITAETRVGRLTRIPLDRACQAGAAEVIHQFESGAWADGICLDEEGGIWVADPRGRRCVRVLPGRGVVDVISTEHAATSCVLGGEGRRTLYITTGARARTWDDMAANRLGRVEAYPVAVSGAGRP